MLNNAVCIEFVILLLNEFENLVNFQAYVLTDNSSSNLADWIFALFNDVCSTV
jgi:hypothetical protein